MNEFPQVATIAGTDSGGGAGVMADLKTMQARHVFGTAVVVAVTAQNTLGVQDFMAMPTKLIDEQFASLAAVVLAGAGELVASQLTADRPATFAIDLIDRLSLVTVSEIQTIAKVD
ncbi:hypothetical protein WP50_32545 [Lactiplantibacillus plantarum]|nr:hypothetical protein WP50_32545 [Lactiplantibacillus plantarum]